MHGMGKTLLSGVSPLADSSGLQNTLSDVMGAFFVF